MEMETLSVRKASQALRRTDPFEEVEREMARLAQMWTMRWPLFNRLMPFGESRPWAPTIDMFRKGNKLVLEMDLPGLKKEDVEVLLEDGDLVLKGKRQHDEEVDEQDYYRMERVRGEFYRRIPLPSDVDVRMVQARFEHGVLHIEIPQPPEAKAQAQKVKVH
jgi:HSP20 family protein